MKRRKKKINPFYSIIIRYLILAAVGIPNLWLFYLVLTPLTVYPVYFLLKIFFATSFAGSTTILVNDIVPIELVKSCIAGAAYYLLLILNLSVPNINVKKRLIMIGSSFLALYILNIIRIVLLSWIYISDNAIFDITHKIFWYGVSTILVVGIWFAEVKIFKIKDIPIYSDIKLLFKHSISVR
jgi:exosortase/archaeosortase family protein